jgi:DNA-binding NtrC family response regulator
MIKILVVDDEGIMRDLAIDTLERLGYTCLGCKDVPNGLRVMPEFNPDLILSDFKMPGMTGLDFLNEVLKTRPQQAFVLMTAYGTVETAVEAMRVGASDFIEKPFDPDLLEMVVARALERMQMKKEITYLRKELNAKHAFIGGNSTEYTRLKDLIEKVADSNATVLITGESGVGKEVLARAVHSNSARALGAFVKINCAALPENLIESELFGYEKGAFTGAMKTKKGKFELADKGTLLLDEIGEMPLLAQAKLLRVLQEREVSRIGADEEISVDVRIVCTTNRDLSIEVQEGRFREDLFYRLNVIPVHAAPLRERKEDIVLLIQHFIDKFNNEYGYQVTGMTEESMAKVTNYPWPGNIRQLENAMERAMVFSKTGLIGVEHFDLLNSNLHKTEENQSQSAPVVNPDDILAPGMTISKAEQILIIKTLTDCEGNKNKAAEMLDISIRTLRNKLHEYGAFEYQRSPSEDGSDRGEDE